MTSWRYQLRAALAELFLGWAMALDPTDSEPVLKAYRDLAKAKLEQIQWEIIAHARDVRRRRGE